MTDPRDIERINPENTPVNTSVNDVPSSNESTTAPKIQGAVVNQQTTSPQPAEPTPHDGGKDAG